MIKQHLFLVLIVVVICQAQTTNYNGGSHIVTKEGILDAQNRYSIYKDELIQNLQNSVWPDLVEGTFKAFSS